MHPVFEILPELVTLRRIHLTGLELRDATLFVDVDPVVSLERIEVRGVSRQVHETEEKLTKLRQGYRMVCHVVAQQLDVPAFTLDGHQPLASVVAQATRQVRDALGSRLTSADTKEADQTDSSPPDAGQPDVSQGAAP